jgi:Flp pilus assembly pilin Flp
MTFLNLVKNFHNDESGAVTVDWVVLTAAIVGLGLVVMTTVSGGLRTAATNITTDLNAKQVAGTALNTTTP